MTMWAVLAFSLVAEPATLRDCPDVCPEMVIIPAGSFVLGRAEAPDFLIVDERPTHRVTFSRPFAVARFETTYAEWDACLRAGACPRVGVDGKPVADDEGWGRGRQPVINVSWDEAQTYVRWLSQHTGERYRLLSEAEWEYAARSGVTTQFSTGEVITRDQANIGSRNLERSMPVGAFMPNAFGLNDVHGNVYEWVQDCYAEGYEDAPDDGSAFERPACQDRIMRGGSFNHVDYMVRLGSRNRMGADWRLYTVGFRVARDLEAGKVE